MRDINYKKLKLQTLLVLCLFSSQILLFSQSTFDINQSTGGNHSVSIERYITDDRGNILIHVNVWGHVKNPGHHLVYDGIDMPTFFHITDHRDLKAAPRVHGVHRKQGLDLDETLGTHSLSLDPSHGQQTDP